MIVRLVQNTLSRLFGFRSKEPLFHLVEILGFEPHDMSYYELAFRHSSVSKTDASGFKLNNERLEFLGDSVLATAMSHYLYLHYPAWDEGELSKRRGTIVKRAVNNAVAQRMGLDKMLQIRREARHSSADIYGNTLEALIGAIFLDRGYTRAEEFVHHRVLPLFLELEQSLREQTTNYKSLLLEWTQKHHLALDFRMLQEPKKTGATFICAVFIDEKKVGVGSGQNKKEAHQDAAHRALLALCEADALVASELGLKVEELKPSALCTERSSSAKKD
ncbi:ribonuclease III [Porphyromonas catoniae F0037]|jgi:ribonuclease III|uniref:Ribonuclease 3 n=1 Tax=Porphyromonas catoniae F0037 TaxID=1127696 RepID=L1NGX7_9PORP|nr:ribonuclease III [Porphyromonas catoniae]EKY02749.1 ribonuclease III [Porphyromonas catoniae F0037]